MVANKVIGHRYLLERDPGVLRAYAAQVERQLSELKVDAILAPTTLPVAYLETDLPIITWTDATFGGVIDYLTPYSNLSGASMQMGHAMERTVISRAAASIYASTWASRTSLDMYGADPHKVHVLPFGANLTTVPDRSSVEALVARRSGRACRLIFIGSDWFDKGGDLVLALAHRLVALGLPTHVTIIGCPARDVPRSDLIDYIGYIDKSSPSGEAELGRLLGESHFHCLPSRAECFGIVFCEASAFGVPSLAARTGGVGSAVKHGRNGLLFDERSFLEQATETVVTFMNDRDSYTQLALSSHDEYRSRLNWRRSTGMLVQLISSTLDGVL
jgi:glycosyltransferase involved in cell wall biosynthesis